MTKKEYVFKALLFDTFTQIRRGFLKADFYGDPSTSSYFRKIKKKKFLNNLFEVGEGKKADIISDMQTSLFICNKKMSKKF